MYDSEYQIIAQNCKMANMIASILLFHHKAAIIVSTRKKIISKVAISRVLANILFNCATGPIKKHVLANATKLPIEYSMANFDRLPVYKQMLLNIEMRKPRAKQAAKALIRVLQDNDDASKA